MTAMSDQAISHSGFPTIDEIKYNRMANKKLDCVVYARSIPVIFLRNPKRLNLRSFQTAAGSAMIFFLAGSEEKALKISNLFADFDCYYSSFLAAGLSVLNGDSPKLKRYNISSTRSCTGYRIPTGIEPHEGIEYALMQKGLKCVAMFEYCIPIEFITNPLQLDIKYLDFNNGQGRIYYKSGHEISAKELSNELSKSISPFDEDHIRRVGRLLGYQNADIEQYIEYCRDLHNFYGYSSR